MDLGKRIRKRREELNISQDVLAKRLGYKSRSSINKIELGLNDITQSRIVAIAKALDTTPAYLMGWEEDNKQVKLKDLLMNDPVWQEKIKKWENAEPVSDEHLLKLIDAYKNNPAMQKAVDTLLGIEE